MGKLIFRGAYIRYMDVRQDEDAGAFVRLHLTADYSQPVQEAMDWEPVPESITSAKLAGRLAATHLILTPNGPELRQHELQLSCTDVCDFQLFRVQNDDGETTRTELRFQAKSAQDGAAALVENYIRRIGKGIGQLRVSYTKQEELDLGEDLGEKDTGCIECNNGIPLAQGDPSMHDSGQPCMAYSGRTEPAIASAREAAGGTHQRKRRGQIPDPVGVQ